MIASSIAVGGGTKRSTMRRLILSVAILGFAPSAWAADYGGAPYLRGSQVYEPGRPLFFDWSGAYIGGQAGYSYAHMDFGPSWGAIPVLGVQALEAGGKANGSAGSYGAFAGFNSQWDEVIVGLEVNYNHTSLRSSVAGTPLNFGAAIGTQFEETHLSDFGTLRARAGYIMGRYLPYVMVGVAAARAEKIRTATLVSTTTGALVALATDSGAIWAFGYAAGVGIDVAFSHNWFLRAEYEYVQFANDIDTGINTVRAALAYRF
jgi:opacity protein-like surface antigen